MEIKQADMSCHKVGQHEGKNKVYVAFSVHGKKKFISANFPKVKVKAIGRKKNTPTEPFEIEGLPGTFTVVQSRRPAGVLSTGDTATNVKLQWSELNAKSNGEPYRSMTAAKKKFALLAAAGWNVYM